MAQGHAESFTKGLAHFIARQAVFVFARGSNRTLWPRRSAALPTPKGFGAGEQNRKLKFAENYASTCGYSR